MAYCMVTRQSPRYPCSRVVVIETAWAFLCKIKHHGKIRHYAVKVEMN